MTNGARARLWAATACALMAWACGASTPGTETERWQVTLTVRPDGALDVVETVTVGHRASPLEFVRLLPLSRIDRVTAVSARVNGTIVEHAIDRIERPGLARIAVPLEAGTQTASVRVAYTARGALRIIGTRGQLEWPALPPSRQHAIAQADIELRFHDGVAPVGTPGIASSGWTVAWNGTGIDATRAPVPADDDATVSAEVRFAGALPVPPLWQFDAERARELTPAFVSGGICIVAIGIGILWILRWQYPPPRPAAAPAGAGSAPATPDRGRLDAARGLRAGGLVIVALGVVTVAVTPRLLWRYGWPPIAMAASILIVGALFLIASRWFRR